VIFHFFNDNPSFLNHPKKITANGRLPFYIFTKKNDTSSKYFFIKIMHLIIIIVPPFITTR
jgi:hypothetical protein